MKKSMKKMLLTVLTFTMLLLMSFSAQAAKISARQTAVGVGAATTLKVKGTKRESDGPARTRAWHPSVRKVLLQGERSVQRRSPVRSERKSTPVR